MRLWIAEKPAVASDIAKALGGNFTRHDGYAESRRSRSVCPVLRECMHWVIRLAASWHNPSTASRYTRR